MPARRTGAVGSLVTGFGLGGLADGIVLHQLLQWHNLGSSVETNDTVDGLRRNLLWDGLFHASVVIVAVAGALLLLQDARRGDGRRIGPRSAAGMVLVGWGTFHAVDQFVFHLVLGLHHIREEVASPALYDWGFFAIGLLLAAAGAFVVARAGAERR